MTNDPGKVWPEGIVHYVMDTSLGKYFYVSFMLSTFLNICEGIREKVPLCSKMHLSIYPKITKLKRYTKSSFIISSLTLLLGLPCDQVLAPGYTSFHQSKQTKFTVNNGVLN